MTSLPAEISYRTCPLCEATCGLSIEHSNGVVTRIRGDQDDVFSKGFLCPKGTALGKFHDDPDRLRTPLIRRNGVHEPATWDEAFAAIAHGMLPELERTERDGGAIYLGNPVVHSLDLLLYSRAITTALGSRKVFSASTVDQRPREVASGLLYGSSFTTPVPDIDRTTTLLLIGANPIVSNGSLATAPDWPGRIQALLDRGGSMIVVDPAFTKTAAKATMHIAPFPGTDALLLAAIATELVATGVHRPVEADRDKLEAVVAALGSFTPDSVSEATGISAHDVRQVVSQLVAAVRPCVYARLGTTITPFGTTASWLVDVVNALLGALDAPGGAMFPSNPAGSRNTRGDGPFGPQQSLGRRRTKVSGLPIELGEHPVSALAEEIESGNVTVLITVAGNPVLSCPDSSRLASAFEQLEFMVSLDCYLNETTRHADVILPPPSHLQKSHFDVAFGSLMVRNVANYSAPIFPLANDGLPEWEIAARLASVVGGGTATAAAANAVDEAIVEQLVRGALGSPRCPHGVTEDTIRGALGDRKGPERVLDLMVRSGPFGDWFGATDGLSLDVLIEHPHGIDLGALEPRFPEVLLTPTGRPEFDHPDLMGDLDRLETLLDAPTDGLRLINRRTLRSNNSWMHNLEILVKGKPRCTMLMHPRDADERGLNSGDIATVASSAGSVDIAVELDKTLRPGVVSIPHGWGHGLEGTLLGVASSNAGVNVNILTPTTVVDPLSGTSQLTGFRVDVTGA